MGDFKAVVQMLPVEVEYFAAASAEREEAIGYLSALLRHYSPASTPHRDLRFLCLQIDSLLASMAPKRERFEWLCPRCWSTGRGPHICPNLHPAPAPAPQLPDAL